MAADPNLLRADKSLGLLTTKFVDLLKGAQDGILDLKQVSDRQTDIVLDVDRSIDSTRLTSAGANSNLGWPRLGLVRSRQV